jgi:predicted site-specific integrase-resolvase
MKTSIKVARCCVHAENKKERRARIYRDDTEKESEIIDDKIQMLCERLSTTNCGKDDKRRVHRKTSKVGE